MTSRVELHPASLKHIKKGHPWVTLDKFSARFPKGAQFVSARMDEKNFVLMLNDPGHPNVKARVWNIEEKSRVDVKDFIYDLKGRLYLSMELRENNDFGRDNYYIVFGEADKLPGLFVQKLKDHILIQFYADFWNHYEKDVLRIIKEKFPKSPMWIQKRNLNRKKEFYCATNKRVKNDQFILNEFGVNYKIAFNEYYDIGIYTDMSAIRERITPELEGKKVLNLFSYTGAYSLYALNAGAEEVVSVDLSKKYINWLEENLALNEQLDASKHTSITQATKKALEGFVKEERKFDTIICDPPSASSDGKKVTKAIDAYKELIPLIEKCLVKKGKAIVFLNTHSITRRKFEDKIRSYSTGGKLKVSGSLKLIGDCPSLKGFPEGDYLKGLILHKS